MAIRKLELKAGITSQLTPTLADGTWSQSQYIRWKDGLLQKLGGWVHINPDDEPFVAPVRGLHAWADLNDNEYLAGGSPGRLQILVGGQLLDITPVRLTLDVACNFSTVIGTKTITVVAASNGTNVGDWVDIYIPVSVAGLILLGFYIVDAVVDADTFTITAASNALSTVNNGGAVPLYTTVIATTTATVTLVAHGYAPGDTYTGQISTTVNDVTIAGDYLVQTVVDADNFTITTVQVASASGSGSENGGNAEFQFAIAAGRPSAALVTGYGAGGYGLGPYGGPQTGTTYLPLQQWALDNYGQDLIAGFCNGPIYRWQPSGAFGPATLLSGDASMPTIITWQFTAMPSQQIMVTGASVGLELTGQVLDPLLVKFSDSGLPEVWTPTSTNQAGSFRLSTGSRIIGSLQVSQQGYIWTDIGLWVAQYVGEPFVWSFQETARGCGLIGARARAILNDQVFWLSGTKVMIADQQGVREFPCAVWDIIFRNLNTTQAAKIVLGANSGFEEIWILFPSASGNGENDSYVKVHVPSGNWDYGTIIRTDWIDQSILGPPIGIDETGAAQQHETGNNADGAVLSASALSGFIDVTDGTYYWRIDQIIPDFILTSGAVIQLTLLIQDYPNGPIRYKGPFTVTSSTQYISIQGGRGRQIAFLIESEDLGSFWRLGAVRYRGAPDGRL